MLAEIEEFFEILALDAVIFADCCQVRFRGASNRVSRWGPDLAPRLPVVHLAFSIPARMSLPQRLRMALEAPLRFRTEG